MGDDEDHDDGQLFVRRKEDDTIIELVSRTDIVDGARSRRGKRVQSTRQKREEQIDGNSPDDSGNNGIPAPLCPCRRCRRARRACFASSDSGRRGRRNKNGKVRARSSRDEDMYSLDGRASALQSSRSPTSTTNKVVGDEVLQDNQDVQDNRSGRTSQEAIELVSSEDEDDHHGQTSLRDGGVGLSRDENGNKNGKEDNYWKMKRPKGTRRVKQPNVPVRRYSKRRRRNVATSTLACSSTPRTRSNCKLMEASGNKNGKEDFWKQMKPSRGTQRVKQPKVPVRGSSKRRRNETTSILVPSISRTKTIGNCVEGSRSVSNGAKTAQKERINRTSARKKKAPCPKSGANQLETSTSNQQNSSHLDSQGGAVLLQPDNSLHRSFFPTGLLRNCMPSASTLADTPQGRRRKKLVARKTRISRAHKQNLRTKHQRERKGKKIRFEESECQLETIRGGLSRSNETEAHMPIWLQPPRLKLSKQEVGEQLADTEDGFDPRVRRKTGNWGTDHRWTTAGKRFQRTSRTKKKLYEPRWTGDDLRAIQMLQY